MSHELRTPLNAIIGVSEMLREDAETLKQEVAMRTAASILLVITALIITALIATGCARTEVARFQPGQGQQALVRDGQPAIVSRRASSLVMVRPASRQFKAGRRPVYVVAINNMGAAPLQFTISNLWVGQIAGGKVVRGLKVYTYEELVQEERNRQVAAAVVTGLAAGANAAGASQAGYYNANATVYGHTSGCHRAGQHALLYVGIAPKPPPMNGRAPSRSNLRQRLRTHYYGNAEGSTLRRTLGCLLSDQLGIKLRRVGSGRRYTFTNTGEQLLDDWMRQNAFVTWVETGAPWELETQLLSSGLRLPLNVDGNPWAEGLAVVRAVRLKAKQLADALDIVMDNGGPRRPAKISTPPSPE
jgi:hypothetical protein